MPVHTVQIGTVIIQETKQLPLLWLSLKGLSHNETKKFKLTVETLEELHIILLGQSFIVHRCQ